MSAAARRAHAMRNRLGASFDQECSIFTPTEVSNGAGGRIDGKGATQNGIPCTVRFPHANPRDPLNQATETSLTRIEIRLPVGTPVSVKSTITVGEFTYEVRDHDVGKSYAAEIVCDCIRADDGRTDPTPAPQDGSGGGYGDSYPDQYPQDATEPEGSYEPAYSSAYPAGGEKYSPKF